MRIDLSPKGQIVGTRRVPETGQIAGLQEHAGKEVLILLPNGRPILRNTVRDYLHEWEQIATRNAKWAEKELRAWQKKLPKTRKQVVKLAKDQLEAAKAQLALETLAKRLPVRQAQREVERRIKRARKQVREAETWVRARLTMVAPRTAAKTAA